MRGFKWLAGLFGIGDQKVNKDSEDENDVNTHNNPNSVEELHHHINTNLPRKGFSVPVQVPVDKAHQIGPILVPRPAGDGGVQGLGWYTRSLKIDEDGDVADEFLDEVLPDTVSNSDELHLKMNISSKFQVKLNTKPAKARSPCLSREGTIQHRVQFEGRRQLIG